MQLGRCIRWLHSQEGEKGESDEEIVPGREADLKLTDVPEDMREAVQGASSHLQMGHRSVLLQMCCTTLSLAGRHYIDHYIGMTWYDMA